MLRDKEEEDEQQGILGGRIGAQTDGNVL